MGVDPHVEPDGAVERRALLEQDVGQLGVEGVGVGIGREVAVGPAPAGDGVGHPADHLLDRCLALRRAQGAAEVLAGGHLGRELRPRLGELEALLLEDRLPVLVGDGRLAGLPLDRVVRVHARPREPSLDADPGPGPLLVRLQLPIPTQLFRHGRRPVARTGGLGLASLVPVAVGRGRGLGGFAACHRSCAPWSVCVTGGPLWRSTERSATARLRACTGGHPGAVSVEVQSTPGPVPGQGKITTCCGVRWRLTLHDAHPRRRLGTGCGRSVECVWTSPGGRVAEGWLIVPVVVECMTFAARAGRGLGRPSRSVRAFVIANWRLYHEAS